MFKVDVNRLRGFTTMQEHNFLFEVVPLLEKVANSVMFKELVLSYSEYQGGFKNRNKPPHTTSKNSNARIYSKFMSGADKFNPEPDADLDLFLTSYYSRKNVIGYTYKGTFHTWVNRKYFVHRLKSKKGRCRIVGNIIHEYMHNLGYSHNRRWNRTRKHTVPYAYGIIAEKVARTLLEDN